MATRRRRVVGVVFIVALALLVTIRAGKRAQRIPRASFAGKVVVVTGSSYGLGRALSKSLAHLGAKLVLVDVDVRPSETLARHVVAHGGNAVAVDVDLADDRQRPRALATALARFGTVDILFNNAAYVYTSRVSNSTLDAAHHMFEVNFWAYVDLAVQASRIMKERGSGLIVNISSEVATDEHGWENDGWTGIGFYVAAKAAINGLFKTMAAEMEGSGVVVKVACPGGIKTKVREHARGPDRAGFLKQLSPFWPEFAPASAVAEKILINIGRDDVMIPVDRLR